jgi:hypothetical protein
VTPEPGKRAAFVVRGGEGATREEIRRSVEGLFPGFEVVKVERSWAVTLRLREK